MGGSICPQSEQCWIELRVDAAREAVDWVSMAVAEAGCVGDVQIEEHGEVPMPAVLRLYLLDDGSAQALIRRVMARLDPLQRAGLVGDLFVERVAAPREIDTPAHERIGQRFVLLPPGDVPEPGRLPLFLKTRGAFGSGLHPTTRLCLALLERHTLPGMQALDLGTGTGILAVALARLGTRIVAVDNDARAVATAQANVRLNLVAEQIEVVQGSLGAGASLGHWMGWDEPVGGAALEATGRFDLVVANILARMHLALAPDYRRALRAGPLGPGRLVVAGFTAEREDEIVEALQDADFTVVDRETLDEWVALACHAGE